MDPEEGRTVQILKEESAIIIVHGTDGRRRVPCAPNHCHGSWLQAWVWLALVSPTGPASEISLHERRSKNVVGCCRCFQTSTLLLPARPALLACLPHALTLSPWLPFSCLHIVIVLTNVDHDLPAKVAYRDEPLAG